MSSGDQSVALLPKRVNVYPCRAIMPASHRDLYYEQTEINAIPARLTINGRKAITSATANQIKANGRTSATVDQLVADGMLWTDFIAPIV
jgi:hypothetical protein